MRIILAALMCMVLGDAAYAAGKVGGNAFEMVPVLAVNAELGAPLVQPGLADAGALAVRKDKTGTQLWVGSHAGAYAFAGDVQQAQDEELRLLKERSPKFVQVPVGGDDKSISAILSNLSGVHFPVTHKLAGGATFTTTANLIFAGRGGVISAWGVRRKADGGVESAGEAVTVIDRVAQGTQYTGLSFNEEGNLIYAVNFGKAPGIQVFDSMFRPVGMEFDLPFDYDNNNRISGGELAPYSILRFTRPNGRKRLLVAHAMAKACWKTPKEKGLCTDGETVPGQEELRLLPQGAIAEFDEFGYVVSIWRDTGHELSAPVAMAFAPMEFQPFGGQLIVANYGSGLLAVYDVKTRSFVDHLRGTDGKPLILPRLRGMVFGDGVMLGNAGSLYVSAAPKGKEDGVVYRIRPAAPN